MPAPTRAPMAASKGVGAGLASARGNGLGTQRGADQDSRLIEEAIRAAMPAGLEGPEQRSRPAQRDDRSAVTRRVSGRPTNPSVSSAVTPSGALATRGLGHGQDEEAIEDTQAARALLKALSAVK
jgi:hypothetical protein